MDANVRRNLGYSRAQGKVRFLELAVPVDDVYPLCFHISFEGKSRILFKLGTLGAFGKLA